MDMATLLLQNSAEVLLDKFGAGEHKPGSGSAAALQGMLAAQLVRTVNSLSLDPKRESDYRQYRHHFIHSERALKERIYPALEKLFYDDSAAFDNVITLRRQRDSASDESERRRFGREALLAQKPATIYPMEIAELSFEIADFAKYNFRNGFRSARGDSGVALSSAVACVAGCISIVDLNLLSFESDQWTEAVEVRLEAIRRRYVEFEKDVAASLKELRGERVQKMHFRTAIAPYKDGRYKEATFSADAIERITVDLQNLMWKYRSTIWKSNVPTKPIDVLDPQKAMTLLGYTCEETSALGEFERSGKRYDVAGLIDNDNKRILISQSQPVYVRRFTAGHELGHAVLHNQTVMHHDRAIDGAKLDNSDGQEEAADKFSSFFLMPKKLVMKAFRKRFLAEKFQIDEATAFAFSVSSGDELKRQVRDYRGLSIKLAKATAYNGDNFTPIHEAFGVSPLAMARRLRELRLLSF